MGDGAGARIIKQVGVTAANGIGKDVMGGLAGTPLLARGLGVMIGEWIFGPSGPILFHGLGLGAPVAAMMGVLLGAGLGYFVAGKAWSIYQRRATASHAGYGGRIDRHWGTSLRL